MYEDHKFNLIQKFLLNRRNRLVIGAPWGQPCSVTPADADSVILAHLHGKKVKPATVSYQKKDGTIKALCGHFRVGVYSQDENGCTLWTCIDFDGGADHANSLADPLSTAVACCKNAKKLKLHSYLEQSGSGAGWHVWFFFGQPIHVSQARALGLMIAPKDAPLLKGGTAEPKLNIGIEVFPKSSAPNAGSFGNPVWLPWWSGAKPGANEFYEGELP